MYVCAVYVCTGLQLYRAARSAARENVRCWCEICTKFAVVSPRNQKRNCSLTPNEILSFANTPPNIADRTYFPTYCRCPEPVVLRGERTAAGHRAAAYGAAEGIYFAE